MPSFRISVNKTTEIRVNVPLLRSSIGVHLSWVGGANETEDGWILFDIAGSDGEEQVRWSTPKVSIGDEITITISDESVVDSAALRTPHEKLARRKLCE